MLQKLVFLLCKQGVNVVLSENLPKRGTVLQRICKGIVDIIANICPLFIDIVLALV